MRRTHLYYRGASFFMEGDWVMVRIAENEDGVFTWHHDSEMQGRMGIISKDGSSELVNQLKAKFQEMNEVNYHITTSTIDNDKGIEEELSIFQFEDFPSQSEESEHAAERMKWVQTYFTMLSYIHSKDRNEFIPLASFRAHAEGPLIGYYRAIQELEDSSRKSLLNEHLAKLESVKWMVSDEHGFVANIVGTTKEELLESFYMNAWAFWLYTAFIQDTRPINLFIELDGALVDFPAIGEFREIIAFVVNSLAKLTFALNMSLTVKSPTLFPLPESLIEHLIIEDADTEDMNWTELPNFPSFIAGEEVVWEHQQTFRKMKLALANDIGL